MSSNLTESVVQPRVLTRSPPGSPTASSKDVKITPARHPASVPVNRDDPASQYTILEKLGTGSFGTVYKGIHNDTKQVVAIKQIGESFARHEARGTEDNGR